MAVVTTILPIDKAFTPEGEAHSELRRRLATALAPQAFSGAFHLFKEFAHILGLYKELFPQAYASSTAPTSVPARIIPALGRISGYSAEDGEIPFSEKEQEFFVLVYKECFHYDIEVFMDTAFQGERIITIPLLSLALETTDTDLSDFRFGIQLILLLIGAWCIDALEEDELFPGHHEEARPEATIEADIPTYYQIAKTITDAGRAAFSHANFSLLCAEYTCATGNNIMETALLAMGFVQADTDNTFFDYDMEYMLTEMDATWDAKYIRDITREWQEALVGQVALSKFFSWLEESTENYRHLVWLFNAACYPVVEVSVREDLLGRPTKPAGKPLWQVLV